MTAFLDAIVSMDEHWSERVAHLIPSSIFPMDIIRFYFLLLEWLVHGLPWLIAALSLGACSYLCKWPLNNKRKAAIFLAGVLFDFGTVGLIKLYVRRPRPFYNDPTDHFVEAPLADQFSFPSGHASRAALLSILIWKLYASTSKPIKTNWQWSSSTGTPKQTKQASFLVSETHGNGVSGTIQRKLQNKRSMYGHGSLNLIDPSLESCLSSRIPQLIRMAMTIQRHSLSLAFVSLSIFPLMVASSRVVMGRHYIGDVLVGLALGTIQAFLVQWIISDWLVLFAVRIADRCLVVIFGSAPLGLKSL